MLNPEKRKQRRKRHEAKMRDMGFKTVTVTVPSKEDSDRVKALAKALREQAKEEPMTNLTVTEARQHLENLGPHLTKNFNETAFKQEVISAYLCEWETGLRGAHPEAKFKVKTDFIEIEEKVTQVTVVILAEGLPTTVQKSYALQWKAEEKSEEPETDDDSASD